MRYASERLSLFRTVFVQVAALLLFAAGGMLLAVAERELNVRPTHHAEMSPAAELLDNRLPAVLKGQPDELPAPAEKSFQKKTRGSQPPFALSGLSPMLQPERPVRLSEAVSALLPSWRGLVAFPLPPPRPPSGPGTAFRLLLGAVPSTRLVFPCRFRSGCAVPPDGLFRKASVSRRSSLRLRLAAWRKNAVRPGCPASTL